jgi:hypothetical protein
VVIRLSRPRIRHAGATESNALVLTAERAFGFALQHVVEPESLRGSSNDLRNEIFLLCQLKAESHAV